jgi:hypothetical protein
VKTKSRNALDSIGAAPFCLELNSEVYPDDFLRNRADARVAFKPDHQGNVQIGVSSESWAELRDICQSLLKARRDSL